MNPFFVMAIVEKISALKTEAYLRDRQARSNLAAFDAWMEASPDATPMPGDETE